MATFPPHRSCDPIAVPTYITTTYRQLDESRDEIRVVILEQGADDDPIKCRLAYSPLGDHDLSYEALSYVWGSAENGIDIGMNNQQFNVTRNLHAALRQLRSAEHDRALWIDAICINQADLAERASQVSRMFQIYSKANCVVAWIGEHEGKSRAAMEMLANWEKMSEEGMADWILSRLKSMTRWLSDITLNAIIALLSRQYFTRIWIVQEIAASTKVVLQCGDSAIDYMTVLVFCVHVRQQCERFGKDIELPAQAMAAQAVMAQINMARYEFSQAGPMRMPIPGKIEMMKKAPLLETLSTSHRQKQGKDAHDYLYALYNLLELTPELKDMLPIDYSISVRDLYINVTYAIIHQSRSLDILTHCYLHKSTFQRQVEGLPSWAIDLSDRAVPTRLQKNIGKYGSVLQEVDRPHMISHVGRLRGAPPFNAGGSIQEFFPTIDETRTRLTVRGVCISRVNLMKENSSVSINPMPGHLFVMPQIQIMFYWRQCIRAYLKAVSAEMVPIAAMSEPEFEAMKARYLQTVEEAFFRLICTERDETHSRLRKFWDDHMNNGAEGQIRPPDGIETSEFEAIRSSLDRRAFFIGTGTTNGVPEKAGEEREQYPLAIGLVPETAQLSDMICLIRGCNVPIVLRETGSGYIVVGDAMVYSIRVGQPIFSFMTGSAVSPGGPAGDLSCLRMQDFVLE